ncbi:TPA: hypothetical protein ACHHRY_002500 [Staphylococcus aureus]|uniref:hypothetical protein n=2 Tax=Staphylococcus aureus TaxID=1280 RepID=UPI0001DA2498|nr:hypothetical protein [Staphylococcus aureus]ADI98425.1 hypothetical protein SAOV_1963 [Staphylococcus aureus subsp. aureus ED133]AXU08987.1 Hypothetical protein SaO17_01846 [Staphylococcus aureus]MBU9769519.1 hypothetical protein [Staphylococcus aureus]MBY0848660.1 hypothetical protein [Staphylococcus aureus]MBZ5365714.1 hypothetical protein [Staphylococcus aureus]
MFEGMKYKPSEFAAAYIQTLPHALKLEDFDTDDEFKEYLENRRESYFYEYLKSLEFAKSFSKREDETIEE